LLSDDEEVNGSAINAAWDEEILARIQAIDDGSAVGVPYGDVIAAARDRRAR